MKPTRNEINELFQKRYFFSKVSAVLFKKECNKIWKLWKLHKTLLVFLSLVLKMIFIFWKPKQKFSKIPIFDPWFFSTIPQPPCWWVVLTFPKKPTWDRFFRSHFYLYQLSIFLSYHFWFISKTTKEKQYNLCQNPTIFCFSLVFKVFKRIY